MIRASCRDTAGAMLPRLCALLLGALAGGLLYGLACAQNATAPPVAAIHTYPFDPAEMTWGGPVRGCAAADAMDGREVKCALPAGDVTLTFNPTRSRLTLVCHRGSYNCSELQVAREHLRSALSASLNLLHVEGCPVREPLACVIALVNASDAASVRLEELRGGLQPAAVRGLSGVTRLRVSVADGNMTSLPYRALAQLPQLRSFSLLRAALDLAAAPCADCPAPPLARLEIADGELSVLPRAAFASYPDLTELLLWGNNMRQIHEDALQGLSQLRNLSLNSNSLALLPAGLLRPARQLRLLHAYKNRLERLPAALLAGLHHLREVRIFNNNASLVLEDGVFSGLASLQRLQLDYSGIRRLPALFLASSPLAALSLRGNSLDALPPGVLNKELVELDLSYNNIGELPADAFDGLGSLRTLDLRGNRLTQVPGRLFASLAHLTRLDLRSNALEDLDSASFEGLASLTALELSANRLTELRAATFAPLGHTLQVLTAAHNGLRLPPPPPAHASAAEYMFYLHSPFRELVRLRTLDLRNNSVRAIANDWRLLVNLEQLDLSYNRIQELTTVDLWFVSRAAVDLRHNNISRLEPPSADAPAATFQLANNPFNCDCDLYSYARALQIQPPPSVQLQGGTCAAPSVFRGKSLASLDPVRLTCVARGCPQHCDCVERPAASRVEMRCDGAPGAFPDLEGDLDVSLRLLSAPGQELRLSPRVRSLDLSGLNLTELPRVTSLNLTEIDLRGNRLVRPPLEAEVGNCFVRIARNPLRCDCDAAAKLAAFAKRNITMFDSDNATCDDGAPLASLRIDDLCAKRRAIEISLALVSAFLLVAVAVLAVVWRCRFRISLCLLKCGVGAADDDARYDMFVSYAHEDEEFVRDILMPQLENLGLKLCLHERDWIPGDWIPEQITRSVEYSRRTLVVLSRHFLNSCWARMEFNVAHARNRVILLVLDESALSECEDAELRAYVSSNTYVRAADPRVWHRLAAAARRPRPLYRLGRNKTTKDTERQESDTQSEDLSSLEKLPELVSRQKPGALKRSDELIIRPDELLKQPHGPPLPREFKLSDELFIQPDKLLIGPDAQRLVETDRPDVDKQIRSLHDKLNYVLTPKALPSPYV